MLVATALLLAAAAVSPAPLPGTFELTVGGALLGTEEFRLTEGPDGVTITGKASLKIPGIGDAVLAQDTKLARDGRPLSYTLDMDVPGQASTVRVVTTPTGYTMSSTARGQTEPSRSQAVDVKTSVFLLDNNFASHVDVLTRGLADLGVGEERAITALVPQVMVALAATIKRGDDGKGSLGGAAVATRTYRLTYANIATELMARAEDGALLQVEVPVQRAIFKRRGFEPAAPPQAAPQEPARPAGDPREAETEVKGPAASLSATFLFPKAEVPVSAVVFLAGSGPNDRDETIGPNRPFADIAAGLGDRGIASLRFDKRTYAIKDKTTLYGTMLRDEYYDDAKAAIALLAAHPKVDPKRIFVVGHSEGAMVSPIVAAGSPGTRGIVMMAPAVRPIDQVLIDQTAFGGKLMGRSDAEIAEQTKALKDTFAVIRDPQRKNTPPFMGASAAYWRELMGIDVPKLVSESKLPILVLQGDKDIQVLKDADFEALRSRAGDGGGRISYRSFPSLNHLFMKVEHNSTGAEYGMPSHVDPAVVSAIADWILGH